MIVLVPLFAPAATAYGIDPIHFAMVFIFANAIGAFTPPMGTLMFVTSIYPKLLHKEKYHWKQQKYLPEEKKHRL